VASSYDVPSQADRANLDLIRERFEKAREEFEGLRPKVKGADALELVSFTEFLDMD